MCKITYKTVVSIFVNSNKLSCLMLHGPPSRESPGCFGNRTSFHLVILHTGSIN
jgi:hypothetical protein